MSYFPPGTSQWTDIEHRLFRFISMNGRGQPLTTFETIVDLIGHTTTPTGLTVWAEWDQGTYPTGIHITAAQVRALNLEPEAFQGHWNYTTAPQPASLTDQ